MADRRPDRRTDDPTEKLADITGEVGGPRQLETHKCPATEVELAASPPGTARTLEWSDVSGHPYPAGVAAKSPAAAATIGSLGDYELLAELGRGGMGIVYQARQRGLNRLVALKTVLSQSSATAEEVLRFRNEAEAAANLRHPGIVAIYDVGEAAGCHYYSMEFIAGDDLSRLIREHALPANQAARYLIQLADAVHYAHENGVLHRDLKPSNVLVDSGGQVKITDFGLAKRVDADSQLTGAGMVVGTPSYMPPEQAMPTRGPVGPACDVYALGAILYELLTCRPPFRAENPLETIRQLIYQEPLAPRQLNNRIPEDLETICLKCLEKEPARRYSSARELGEELQRFIKGEPILARPINRAQRLWRWCRRHPRDASLIGTIIAAVVLGLCGVGWQWLRAERNLKRAERNFELLNSASDEMLVVVEEWVTRAPPRAGPQQERLDSTLQRFEQFLAEEPANLSAQEQLASMHERVADIRRELRQLDRAAQHYQLAIDQYSRLSQAAPRNIEWQRRVADAWDSLGDTKRDAESFGEARAAFDKALVIQSQLVRQQATPRLHGDMARTLYNRGLLRLHTGQPEDARSDFLKAIELLNLAAQAEPADPDFRQGLARCHINLGVLLRGEGDAAAAREQYERAIALLEKLQQMVPGKNEYSVELAQAHMNRGNLLLGLRQSTAESDPLSQALMSFQTAIRILRELSRDYPNIPDYRVQLANGLNGLGAVHQLAGKNEDARPAFEQARDQFQEVLRYSGASGDISSRLGLTLANLALLIPRDQPAERIPLLLQAIEHQQTALELVPQSTTIPHYLFSHRLALAKAQLSSADHQAAAAQADAIAHLSAGERRYQAEAAEVFLAAGEVCQRDQQLDDTQKRAAGDEYARRAVEVLKQAVQSGVLASVKLASDEKWSPLRERPDFQELIAASNKP